MDGNQVIRNQLEGFKKCYVTYGPHRAVSEYRELVSMLITPPFTNEQLNQSLVHVAYQKAQDVRPLVSATKRE